MFYILCIQLIASAGHVALVLCGHVETSVSPNEQLCSAHAGAEQSAWEGGPPVVNYSSPGVPDGVSSQVPTNGRQSVKVVITSRTYCCHLL